MVSLGGRHYLEIIAPDPEQAVAHPQFQLGTLTEPRLITFAVRTNAITALAASLQRAGLQVMGPLDGSRRTASGGLLRWKTLGVESKFQSGEINPIQNLLSVQEKVARQIVAGLALTLSPSEAARLDGAETIDPLAYEYYLRGIDLYAKNDFQLACKVLEKSLELAPNYSPAWANLGKAYTASASFLYGGDQVYRKAELAFARALALQPDAVDARVFMANMLTDTGRVERAVPLLREAVRSNPNHAESHWELGYAYRFAGMMQQSATECETARRIDPAVKLNSSTLNSYLYLGLYDRFLESLPKNDDSALIVFYRGLGEYHRKNNRQAIGHFEHAFQLDSSMLQTRVGKAMSLAMQNHLAQALAILRELENKTAIQGAYDPEAVYKIAQAYSVCGDTVAALRVLKRSIQTGFFPYDYIAADPLLATLHNEQPFSGLLEEARRRHDAFQKNFF